MFGFGGCQNGCLVLGGVIKLFPYYKYILVPFTHMPENWLMVVHVSRSMTKAT